MLHGELADDPYINCCEHVRCSSCGVGQLSPSQRRAIQAARGEPRWRPGPGQTRVVTSLSDPPGLGSTPQEPCLNLNKHVMCK